MEKTVEYFLKQCSYIDGLLENYEKECREAEELRNEERKFREFRTQMYERYSSRYGTVQRGESRMYTAEELSQIRMELADTSFATLIKRFLGIGKSTKDIYIDLMSKLNGLLHYLQDLIQSNEARTEALIAQMAEAAKKYDADYDAVRQEVGFSSVSNWDDYQVAAGPDGHIMFGDLKYTFERQFPHSFDGFQHAMKDGLLNVPYIWPMEEPFGIVYQFGRVNTLQAAQAMQSVIYQMLRLAPEYYMEFHMLDAATAGKDFGELRNLQKVKKQDIVYMNRRVTGGNFHLNRLYLDSSAISYGLDQIDRWMTAVAGEMGEFRTLTEYNHANKQDRWIPYQMIVIDNFPVGFQEKEIQILDRLITNGRTLGIFVILMNNIDRWEEINNKGAHSRESSIQTVLSKDALDAIRWFDLRELPMKTLQREVWKPCEVLMMRDDRSEYVVNIISTLNQEKKLDNLFQNLFDVEGPFGTYDSTDGLHIPFAVTKRGEILEYFLGTAMNAHGLICGGTGSGKSTLLHMLISSIVMNYTPEDVEIWLADYKITEFYSYKTNTPPHIRFIGLSKTPDFSYAFIDKITDEMNRRQNAIAEADYVYKRNGGKNNVTNFNDYRKIYGTFSMRRLIVIIDEFHVMSQHAQAEPDYKIKLENILAEARAMGIIMLFSDQAIVDGLRGLSDKGKKQIKARIALSNYLDELKETLGESDRDKLLSFIHMSVGEVAVQTVKENEDKEEVVTIERATAIYINGTYRYKVNEKARAVYDAQDYIADSFDDRVVEAMDLAGISKWESELPPTHRDGSSDLRMYIGKPVDLQYVLSFPLLQRSGNNMMVMSGSDAEQMRILQAILRSFQRQDDYEIVVLCDEYAGVYREYAPEIGEIETADPSMKVLSSIKDICVEINRLLSVAAQRNNQKKILAVWLGLDAMVDLFQEESQVKPAIYTDLLFETPRKEKGRTEPPSPKKQASEFDDAFVALFGESGDSYDENEDEEPELNAQEEEKDGDDQDCLYNARDDIARIIHVGPSRNIYNLVIYDTAAPLKDFREVNTGDFRHKIAFAMSDNDAGMFLDRANLIRELPENMAYYHDGRRGRKFIPYKL